MPEWTKGTARCWDAGRDLWDAGIAGCWEGLQGQQDAGKGHWDVGGPYGVTGPWLQPGCAPQATQFNMEHFSGMHNWYACSHARPTFCNVCREALSGVTSHGLSCEGRHPGVPWAVGVGRRWGQGPCSPLTCSSPPHKCASSKRTSAAPSEPPTTASGPRWHPLAARSSRMRMG